MTLQEQADRLIFNAMHSAVQPVERTIEDAQRGAPPMRMVCCYCGDIMHGGPPQPISHGVCAPCLSHINAKLDALESAS